MLLLTVVGGVQEYYRLAFHGTGSSATDDKLPALALLNDEQTREYQKWTPFADVWDVRATCIQCHGAQIVSIRMPVPRQLSGINTTDSFQLNSV